MAEIVESLLAVEIGGLVIKTFRFAGFTGEPLVRGDITLSAIETLTSAGRRWGCLQRNADEPSHMGNP